MDLTDLDPVWIKLGLVALSLVACYAMLDGTWHAWESEDGTFIGASAADWTPDNVALDLEGGGERSFQYDDEGIVRLDAVGGVMGRVQALISLAFLSGLVAFGLIGLPLLDADIELPFDRERTARILLYLAAGACILAPLSMMLTFPGAIEEDIGAVVRGDGDDSPADSFWGSRDDGAFTWGASTNWYLSLITVIPLAATARVDWDHAVEEGSLSLAMLTGGPSDEEDAASPGPDRGPPAATTQDPDPAGTASTPAPNTGEPEPEATPGPEPERVPDTAWARSSAQAPDLTPDEGSSSSPSSSEPTTPETKAADPDEPTPATQPPEDPDPDEVDDETVLEIDLEIRDDEDEDEA